MAKYKIQTKRIDTGTELYEADSPEKALEIAKERYRNTLIKANTREVEYEVIEVEEFTDEELEAVNGHIVSKKPSEHLKAFEIFIAVGITLFGVLFVVFALTLRWTVNEGVAYFLIALIAVFIAEKVAKNMAG